MNIKRFNPIDEETLRDSQNINCKYDAWLAYLKGLWKVTHDFDNVPPSIDKDALQEALFSRNVLIMAVSGKPYQFDYSVQKINYMGRPGTALPVCSNPSAFRQKALFSTTVRVDVLEPDALQGVLLGVCPVIGDNMRGQSPFGIFSQYAYRLALLDALTEQNIRNNTHPVILTLDGANDINAKVLKEKLGNFADCVSVISVDSSAGLAPIVGSKRKAADRPKSAQVLDLGDALRVNDLSQAKASILNEAYDMLGIEHVAYEKAERLNVSEVETANTATNAFIAADWSKLDRQLELLAKVIPGFGMKRKEIKNDSIGSHEDPNGSSAVSDGKMGNTVLNGNALNR